MRAGRSRRRAALIALLLLGVSTIAPRSAQAMPLAGDLARRGGGRPVDDIREVSAAGGKPAASARRAFEGFWAADRAGCADSDSVGRMAIQADTIQWYETRCGIRTIAPAGRAAWHLGLECRGEGQRIEARATVWLPTDDTLVVADGPIGPSRRQRYIRCLPR